MATSLNTTIQPRDSGYQGVGVLRRVFGVGEFPGVTTKVVGALPANAQVIGGGIVVTATQATVTLDVGYEDYDGTTLDIDAYTVDTAVAAAAGLIALGALAAAPAARRTVPTKVTVTSSAALTTATFEVIIIYVTLNPSSGQAA